MRCKQCDKYIPLYTLTGRLRSSSYCDSKCNQRYLNAIKRTKPKVWRGVKRAGL